MADFLIDDGKNKIEGLNKEQINAALSQKADSNYVNTELDKKADKSNTYTKSEVDTLIDNLPKPVIFKGTLGVGGTVTELPVASESVEGWEFKCITAGTYAGLTLKEGDTVTCFNPPNTSNYYWDKTGSQDTDTDTWRNIKVNGVEKLGNGISSGAVDFEDTANVKFGFDANGNKISATLSGIYTSSEVNDLLDDKADKSDTYTKAQVDDIVYNILPDDTASGSVANFETDLALPLKSLEIDVNAKQDLHGQSNPYPAGGGKNILDKSSYGFVNGANIIFGGTVQGYADGSLTLRAGTYTFSASVSCNGLYVSDSEAQIAVAYNKTFITFTIAEDKAIKLMIYKAGVTQEDILSYNYQLEVGSTATDYAPYENICPIEGWSEVNIVKCGKNLLDTRQETVTQYASGPYTYAGITYSPNGDASITINGTSTGASVLYFNPITLNPLTSYSFPTWKYTNNRYTFSVTNGWGLVTGDAYIQATVKKIKDDSIVSRSRLTASVFTRGITVREDEYIADVFIRLSSGASASNINIKIQLELGSTASDYEPYAGNTEVINLGGTYYGGHFTQDKDGHRQFVIERRGKKINEFENWYYIGGYAYFECNSPDMKGSSASAILEGLICECYATRTAQQAGSGNVDCSIAGWTYTSTNESRIRIKDNKYNNVTDWLSAVGEYLIIYPLAEPIIIDLPDGEPINTLAGVNNFFADSGNITVTFKQSVNDAINAAVNAANNSRTLGAVNTAKSGETEFEKPEEIEEPKEETKK